MVNGEVYHSAEAMSGEAIPAATSPKKVGYTFSGWDGMPENGKMPADNLTLTAKWTVNQYTITFDSDGGSAVEPITLNYGTEITAPAAPVKEGYTFVGWSPSIPETMPAQNITVTAVWNSSAKYVVTYMVDGEVYHSAEGMPGGAIPAVPSSPVKEGYTFDGWDGMPEDGMMPAENITLTAKWTVNQYIITFDSDGGSAVEPITKDYGAEIVAPAAPVKEGYTFVGWSPSIPETMPAQNITVVAQWQDHRYALTYMLDDEQLLVESIPYGGTVTAPVPAQRLGCEFGGWEGLPSTMPANDVTVYGYNNVMDKDTVALDGHLTERLMTQVCELKDVKVLDLGRVTNSKLIVGGLNSLEKACLPATLTSYDGVLTGCPNLLEVVLRGVADIPSDAFTRSDVNGNMIVYAPENTSNNYDGNVVIGGIAENITLHDGLPLSISTEFTARNISYSRDFSKVSYPSECGGWETIVLPFDVMEITNNGNNLAPFNNGTAGVKNFWLAELAPMGFGSTSRIQANVPYIISMPNSEIYDSSYNITGTVKFSATNATVYPTSEARTYSCPEFQLVPTYTAVAGDADVYPINDEEYDGRHPGAVFVSGLRNVRPFEAYARRTEQSSLAQTMFVIGDMSPTGIMDIRKDDATGAEQFFDLLGRPTTKSDHGLRIMRDANGRYIKSIKGNNR